MPEPKYPRPSNKNTPPKGTPNFNFMWIIGIFLVILLSSFIFNSFNTTTPTELTINEFLRLAEDQKIESAEVHETEIIGVLKPGTVEGSTQFKVVIFPSQIEKMETILVENNITTSMVIPNNSEIWGYILNFGSTILIIFLFWILLSRSMQSSGGGQVFNFGKSTAKLFMDNHPRITLKDVAGLNEVKTEIQEIVDFLKSPEKFNKIGAKIPKGILLVGPPGCGKTLIARAISGEAKAPFFTVSGSEFVEMFVGVGASRVRDLFNQAKKFAPAIIFIDEIDAVGRQRGAGLGGGHDEREQTLNQILVEMDGFAANSGVIIIAATNRPDILDPALLRPGRFDRQMFIDLPDASERQEILTLHSKNKPLGKDVNIPIIAKQTAGFTGADLENLLNEAAILAARRDKLFIHHDEIEDSIDRIVAGPEKKSRQITPPEKWAIAIHETGHAAVLRYYKDLEPVHKITIVSRGRALGYTMQLPIEDRFLKTRTELIHTLSGLLGGRAAEEYFLHDISTGAANDLERVTEVATNMVTKYGMSTKLGQRTFGKESGAIFLGKSLTSERNYSEETGQSIDEEIKLLIDEAYQSAKNIIEEKHKEIKEIAEMLIEKETVSGKELEEVLSRIRQLTPEEKSKNPLFEEFAIQQKIEKEKKEKEPSSSTTSPSSSSSPIESNQEVKTAFQTQGGFPYPNEPYPIPGDHMINGFPTDEDIQLALSKGQIIYDSNKQINKRFLEKTILPILRSHTASNNEAKESHQTTPGMESKPAESESVSEDIQKHFVEEVLGIKEEKTQNIKKEEKENEKSESDTTTDGEIPHETYIKQVLGEATYQLLKDLVLEKQKEDSTERR
ncbi:MAG TPA: ATP-dependent zinc metalloprotease FtsH [Caldisericia bacterium]|nr:ATP-dependent zinc metalloprotease FtsH [Caldisericia bacterium]